MFTLAESVMTAGDWLRLVGIIVTTCAALIVPGIVGIVAMIRRVDRLATAIEYMGKEIIPSVTLNERLSALDLRIQWIEKQTNGKPK